MARRRRLRALLGVLLVSFCAAAGAAECHQNSDCEAPWSSCWTLGSCVDNHCLYEPLTCAAGLACREGQCVATPLQLSAAVAGSRFRLTIRNGGGVAVGVTLDPRRVIVDELHCVSAEDRPDGMIEPAPPAKRALPQPLAPGAHASVDVDLVWITPDAPPVQVRPLPKKGAQCKVTFLYRLDDGSIVAAAPIAFKP